jgi:hypothetical protein
MAEDKKKGLLIALMGKKEPADEEDDGDVGTSLAQDLIDALGKKDPQAVYDAFHAMAAHCEDEEKEEE